MFPEKCFSCQSETTNGQAREYGGNIYCQNCLADPVFLESLQEEGGMKGDKNEAIKRGSHTDDVLSKWRQKKGTPSLRKPKKKGTPRKTEQEDNSLLDSDELEEELFKLFSFASIQEALENFLALEHRVQKVFAFVKGRGLPKISQNFLLLNYPELLGKPGDVVSLPFVATHIFTVLGKSEAKTVYGSQYEEVCELLKIKK